MKNSPPVNLTKQQQHLLKAIQDLFERTTAETHKDTVELANMVSFHLNGTTTGINHIHHKLNNITPKAVIGYQAKRIDWEDSVPWSSVVLFYNGQVETPNWGPNWKFRFVYVDI